MRTRGKKTAMLAHNHDREAPNLRVVTFLAFKEAGSDYNSVTEALAGQETVHLRGQGWLPLPFSSHYTAIQGPRDLVLKV